MTRDLATAMPRLMLLSGVALLLAQSAAALATWQNADPAGKEIPLLKR